jgi:predicted small secreted protein
MPTAAAIDVNLAGHDSPSSEPLVIVAATLALAGCSTISDAGKDFEAGGEAVDEAAQDTRKDMWRWARTP